MNLRLCICLLIISIPAFITCAEENPGQIQVIKAPGLSGFVQDQNGEPLAGVLVQVGSSFDLSNRAGHYQFSGSLSSGRHVVSCYKSGYTESHIPIQLNKIAAGQLNFNLAKTELIKNVSLIQAATISRKQLMIKVVPGVFLDKAGKPAKTADISFRVLDTSGPDINSMPGNFRGQNTGGIIVPIETFGALELDFSSKGNKLRIKKGKFLTVEFPLTGNLKGKKFIPLWSLNEQAGIWKQEGQAEVFQKDGTYYGRARLPHLSTWNVDMPYPSRSSIWVRKILNSEGQEIKGVELYAQGIDYMGFSRPGNSRPGLKGYCLDVKPGARIQLNASYRQTYKKKDSVTYKKASTSISVKTKLVDSSCARNPERGIILESLTLNKTQSYKYSRKTLVTAGLSKKEIKFILTSTNRAIEIIKMRNGKIHTGFVMVQSGKLIKILTLSGKILVLSSANISAIEFK